MIDLSRVGNNALAILIIGAFFYYIYLQLNPQTKGKLKDIIGSLKDRIKKKNGR